MKYERLKKNYTKNIIISLIVIIIIGSVLVLNITKAKYRTTTSINIVNGTVKYSLGDLNVMAVYQQKKESDCTEDNCYEPIEKVPTRGYTINKAKSYCTVPGNEEHLKSIVSYSNNILSVNFDKKGTKCCLYFDVLKEQTSEEVLVSLGRTEALGANFGITDMAEHKNNGKSQMYKAVDDFGDSYYFRGKVDDNWVKYGKTGTTSISGDDIWWRIIRINGDGSIRMIYAGIGSSISTFTNDGYTGNENSMITVTGASRDNNLYYYSTSTGETDDNKYVGYYYDDNNAHGNTIASYAAQKVNSWFGDNLKDELNAIDSKIDQNVGFCADRSSNTSPSTEWKDSMKENGGTGAIETYYGGRLRMLYGNSYPTSSNPSKPTLKCSTTSHKKDDYLLYKSAILENGTKSLEYPVGLITVDEVVFAGGLFSSTNNQYYLYNGKDYWTMTPYYFYKAAYLYGVRYLGDIDDYTPVATLGLRPVINIKSSTQFIGDGTIYEPYTLS